MICQYRSFRRDISKTKKGDSAWSVDVLCLLGFCFCDPNDEYSLCLNRSKTDPDEIQEKASFSDNKKTIKTHRRVNTEYIATTLKYNNFEKYVRKTVSFTNADSNFFKLKRHSFDNLLLIKIEEKSKKILEQKRSLSQDFKKQTLNLAIPQREVPATKFHMLARHDAIFIEDIYISGGSNNCNIDSDISDMKYSSTKKNRRNKLFILPTGSDEYCSNLEDLEDTDISMPTENEAIREYILPINRVSYQKSKQTLKTVSITIQPDINLPTSYMSPSPFFPFSPSMSSLKSEDGLSSSKNSIEYLKVKEKPEKISLLKLYGKLDQILSEVKDLRLTLPSIVRQEIYHYFDENSGKHTKGPHSSLEHKYSSDVHTCNMSDVEKPATSNKFSINLTKIDKYCVQR